ncbi:uncharacterized protein FIBRA_06715 [Fibroporia radiculosa]|uniref:Cytochrome P450 n=1 Tax=Fibroporia radiculosa TaxID=599839 RepID=J4H481_9APHY|nr:uncharacterized protein FIBRA_06715 [Fibroporia radiculosa]CCM04534.1 predicted protein [Fibroporia radiculosa]
MASIPALAGAAILALASYFAYCARWAGRRARLPPGPTPVPVLGNAHQLLEYHQHTFAAWGRQFGPIVYARFFNVDAIILNSLEVAEDLLDKRGAIYSDRPNMVMLDDNRLQAEPGPPPAQRPVAAAASLGPQFGRHNAGAREPSSYPASRVAEAADRPDSGTRGLHLTRQEVGKTAERSWDDAHPKDVRRYPSALMMQIAYGYPVQSADDELVVLADRALDETFTLGNFASTAVDLVPILRHMPEWMPGAGFKRRALKTRKLVQAMMSTPYEIVRREMVAMASHVNARKSHVPPLQALGVAKPSFLRSLLEDKEKTGQLTPEEENELKCVSNIFYIAGSETVATALVSFVLAMVLHPAVLQKARAEMDGVVGCARLPDLEDRDALPYLECVLKETYRWNPSSPLGVAHRVKEDDEYDGYSIPGGSMVIANIWGMMRDPNIYPEPERFKPERFEKRDATDARTMDPRRAVFGFGRRACPGLDLGDISLWLAIARIVATLDIRKARDSAGAEITPAPAFSPGMASRPMPFLCDIRPRSKQATQLVEELLESVAA